MPRTRTCQIEPAVQINRPCTLCRYFVRCCHFVLIITFAVGLSLFSLVQSTQITAVRYRYIILRRYYPRSVLYSLYQIRTEVLISTILTGSDNRNNVTNGITVKSKRQVILHNNANSIFNLNIYFYIAIQSYIVYTILHGDIDV